VEYDYLFSNCDKIVLALDKVIVLYVLHLTVNIKVFFTWQRHLMSWLVKQQVKDGVPTD
jgi:hypothetical protein